MKFKKSGLVQDHLKWINQNIIWVIKFFLVHQILLPEDKGIVQFLRPINDTHNESYIRIPFDWRRIKHNLIIILNQDLMQS